jgi:hypothetical protein
MPLVTCNTPCNTPGIALVTNLYWVLGDHHRIQADRKDVVEFMTERSDEGNSQAALATIGQLTGLQGRPSSVPSRYWFPRRIGRLLPRYSCQVAGEDSG